MHPLRLILPILFVLGWACSSPTNSTSEAPLEGYELVKVDSFEISNFTQVVITDFDPQTKTYLGYSTISDELLLISERGEILTKESKKGEGPGLYGNWNPTGMSFGPRGDIFLEFPFTVARLSRDFEILSQTRISSPLPIRTFGPMGKTPVYELQDSTYALVGPTSFLPAHYLIMNQEGKDTLQHFAQINLQSGEQKSVIPYDTESIYRQTDQVYFELMTKTFVINQEEKELAMLTGLDPKILIYDLNTLSKKSEIPLSQNNFVTYPPLPIGTPNSHPDYIQHRFYSARNQRLIHLGEQDYLVQYFTGISEAVYLSKTAQDEGYSPQQDSEFRRVKLIKDGKDHPIELPSPEGTMILGLPDKKVLVQEPNNPEKEEEVFRFSIYQLRKFEL